MAYRDRRRTGNQSAGLGWLEQGFRAILWPMAPSHFDDDDDDRRLRTVERLEWKGAVVSRGPDTLVVEEPLEIRLNGVPVAVVMRTPGHDEELTRGFLVTEGIVNRATDVISARHCSDVEDRGAEDNVIQVVLAPEVDVDFARLRRNLYVGSSCGICGKTTIDRALRTAPPLEDDCRISSAVLYDLPEQLRDLQDVFARTGGLHAAGLFTLTGRASIVREDVGRHNAVDKVIGRAMIDDRLPLAGSVLMVSGRISFEIVQKALAARIPIVAAVSAPSSLAVDLGRTAAVTLVGFLRDRRMCVYSADHRVVL